LTGLPLDEPFGPTGDSEGGVPPAPVVVPSASAPVQKSGLPSAPPYPIAMSKSMMRVPPIGSSTWS
jgi:hypothetical protein